MARSHRSALALAGLLLAGSSLATAHGAELVIESWRNDDLSIWQEKIIPAFEAKHPDIKLKFQPTAPKEYNSALNAKLDGGTAGDLITCRPFDASLQLFEKGKLESLSGMPELQNYPDFALAAWSTDDGKNTFCIPVASVIHGFMYNKDIFNQLGLKVPATEAEVAKMAQDFKLLLDPDLAAFVVPANYEDDLAKLGKDWAGSSTLGKGLAIAVHVYADVPPGSGLGTSSAMALVGLGVLTRRVTPVLLDIEELNRRAHTGAFDADVREDGPGQAISLVQLHPQALSLLGVAGGLLLSAEKRRRGIKDWGTLVPGHGGVLDRLDSVCLSAPGFYWALRAGWW